MASNPPRSRSRSIPPATSKWCNRVLRPLTSAILRLEKYWKSASIQPHEITHSISEESQGVTSKSRNDGGRASGCGETSDSETGKDDPTWVPRNAVRKRVKHKYSGRRESLNSIARARSRVVVRSPERERLQPGAFTIATPLISGSKSRYIEQDFRDETTIHTAETRLNPAGSSASVKSKPTHNEFPIDIPPTDKDVYGDPSYFSIVGGVVYAFDTFLKITAIDDAKPTSKRVPSLLSMALNKTSEYILQEQDRLDNDEENDEDIDVADVIFTDLEDTYTSTNKGWRPLRTLVRAHGIRLVCETIRKRWIHAQLARYFVLKALEIPANHAAEELLGVIHYITPAMPPPKSLDSVLLSEQKQLWPLAGYMRRSCSLAVFFREISSLLIRGALPAEWMATSSMKSYVIDAMQSVISNDEHLAASVKFLTAVVQASLGLVKPKGPSPLGLSPNTLNKSALASKSIRGGLRSGKEATSWQMPINEEVIPEALNNTICSIFTVLCSVHVARFGSGALTKSPMWHIITHVTSVVQRYLEENVHETKDDYKGHEIRIGYALVTQYLLEHLESTADSLRDRSRARSSPLFLDSVEHFIRFSPNRKELLTALSGLFLQVARCLGRARGRNSFDVVKSLTRLFTSTDLRRYPTFRAALAKVAVEVALNFAEYTCLREHHEWAAELQEEVAESDLGTLDHRVEPLTPSLCLKTTGFRWEDGIGEWVAKTPCAKRNVTSRGSSVKAHQQARLTSEKTDSSSTADGDSDSGWGSAGDDKSSIDEFDSSVTSNFSPPPFPRKRKFGSDESEFEDSAVSDTTSAYRMRRWRDTSHSTWNSRYDNVINAKAHGPTTRNQRAPQDERRPNNKRSTKAISIAIAVELPSAVPRKSSDFEVVIHTNDFKGGAESVSTGDSNSGEMVDDDDDVITTSAPTLYERNRDKRPRHSYPQVVLHSSKYISQSEVHFPRRSSARLASRQRQQNVIPCSDGNDSSDDELSFL
ncbi:hypothetical protein D8B26_003261 [Coccidioides posadasii str. Silveira]|uniref:Uncharacterized protein n=2 Tax=Coccidioides posadasii TaxID=199306 RepID=E9D091_COCPS|nr:conserved hypothetical protein [Coccidioides posadasii str. Silveira]KMM73096.1 hypothetical protein CPAG_09385 [Coccidioides posadasii RMSCC 3488]QVM08575.1 hypothetical protein D8B26_003261 [Coccidioides posadasii str. Silveira]